MRCELFANRETCHVPTRLLRIERRAKHHNLSQRCNPIALTAFAHMCGFVLVTLAVLPVYLKPAVGRKTCHYRHGDRHISTVGVGMSHIHRRPQNRLQSQLPRLTGTRLKPVRLEPSSSPTRPTRLARASSRVEIEPDTRAEAHSGDAPDGTTRDDGTCRTRLGRRLKFGPVFVVVGL